MVADWPGDKPPPPPSGTMEQRRMAEEVAKKFVWPEPLSIIDDRPVDFPKLVPIAIADQGGRIDTYLLEVLIDLPLGSEPYVYRRLKEALEIIEGLGGIRSMKITSMFHNLK